MINRKIEYFVSLAETLSFSRTALRHNVSQTAISQYLAGLEKKLGVILVDRSRHSVALTAAGESYYRYVTEILSRDARELELLHSLAAGYHGSLKVGVGMYEYCSTEGFISSFLSAYPLIRVDVLQYPYSVLIEKLKTQELDIVISDALFENAFSKKEILSRTLFESPNFLAASPDVAAKYASPTEMLKNECLITNCEDDGPSSLGMLRKLMMDQYGFVPEKIAQTNSVNAQLMLLRARRGIALVPGFVLEKQGSDLTTFPLPQTHAIRYNLMCLSGTQNDAAEKMLSFEMNF